MPQLISRWEAEALRIREQRGQQDLTLMLLEQQCGSVPSGVAAQVRDLSSPQLADLARALLRFSQLSDLTTWLAAHPPAAR